MLDTAWQLARERGLLSVTMAQVAEGAGIGRATLYKYFSSVEEMLVAHHERIVAGHLADLHELADDDQEPLQALRAVLSRYARICQRRTQHGALDIRALVHTGQVVDAAELQVIDLIARCVRAAQQDGTVRSDIAAKELAIFCLHALEAAGKARSAAAVHRLVDLVESSLQSAPVAGQRCGA